MAARDSTSNLTQSVERALSILTCFTDAHPEWRVSDLGRQLDLSQSTVSRLLATLEGLGFVERNPRTGLYGLGLELVTLAGVALNQNDVQRQAVAELSSVATDLGLAANLAILRADEIFYLVTVEGPKAPKLFTMIGKRNPVHCTAMGKVLVAHLSPPERDALLDRIGYPTFTPQTAPSKDGLRPMLDRIVDRGHGIEREELAFGRACLAAPVRDAAGAVVAAASISGPLSALDLDHREPDLVARVIEMADRISHKLGFVTAPPTALPTDRRASGQRLLATAEADR